MNLRKKQVIFLAISWCLFSGEVIYWLPRCRTTEHVHYRLPVASIQHVVGVVVVVTVDFANAAATAVAITLSG